jgi:hypothetical protein
MKDHFSAERIAEMKALFPEKYQALLIRAIFFRSHGSSFEVAFKTYEDYNQFHLIFDRADFSEEKFPEGLSVGIWAKCPNCGKLNAASADLDLVALNAVRIKEMTEKGGEIINVCLCCLIDLVGPKNMLAHCEETAREADALKERAGQILGKPFAQELKDTEKQH